MANLPGLLTPPIFKALSRVHDLKMRLDWGEPALTIIDVRDRQSFNAQHITGAISMPASSLVAGVSASLEPNRDIYIYGETDDETAVAASCLREAGYTQVAELRGGLAAWKAAGYPTESTSLLC